jgi:hypothetical protein
MLPFYCSQRVNANFAQYTEMDPKIRDCVRRHFLGDREDKVACGAAMPTREVNAFFDKMTSGLVAVLRDKTYTEGPRSGDRWDVVYKKIVLTSGVVVLTEDQNEDDEEYRFSLRVIDSSRGSTAYDVAALKTWVANAFCDAVCMSDVDRDMCMKELPWKRIGIVNASLVNVNTLIAMHQSYVANPREATRKRLGGASGSSKRKKARRAAPEPVPEIEECEDYAPADDFTPSEPAASTELDLRDPTPPPTLAEEGVENVVDALREKVAELTAANIVYARQVEHLERSEQCLKMEVTALRRCEQEIVGRRTQDESALANEQALRQGMEMRAACLEAELQKTQATVRNMEVQITWLSKFLEEGTKAAGRIAAAYGGPQATMPEP